MIVVEFDIRSVMSNAIHTLYAAVLAARSSEPSASRTSKLFADGISKMAKKLVEEAIEVGLDAVQSDRAGVVRESADLLYNLCVVWAHMGITPQDIWAEMERRERLLGIAEKLPKVSPVAEMTRTEITPERAPPQSARRVRRIR